MPSALRPQNWRSGTRAFTYVLCWPESSARGDQQRSARPMGHSPTQRFLPSSSIFKLLGLKTQGGFVHSSKNFQHLESMSTKRRGALLDTIFSNDSLADSSLAVQLPSKAVAFLALTGAAGSPSRHIPPATLSFASSKDSGSDPCELALHNRAGPARL